MPEASAEEVSGGALGMVTFGFQGRHEKVVVDFL
jgi:hypothetical protein